MAIVIQPSASIGFARALRAQRADAASTSACASRWLEVSLPMPRFIAIGQFINQS
jgi:hypothetical protein